MACPICKGKKVVECPKCNGKGEITSAIFSNSKCSNCKGTGKVKCSCA